MYRYNILPIVAASLCLAAATALAQDKNNSFDVRSTVGDMHMGTDADAQAAGFAPYPGARIKVEKENDPLNFGILTEAFGFKIVVVKYESDDPPAKILAFYRDKLKKYGKVLDCHTSDDSGGIDLNDDDKNKSNELKCEGDSKGPINELKAGTLSNQHIVAVESPESQKKSTFALVYLYARGKHGDI